MDDIQKFQCQTAEDDYDVYRCLTRHDTQLSKQCYTVTTDYERSMSGQ